MVFNAGCPPGEEYHECGMLCERMCLPFLNQMKMQGKCIHDNDCIDGCIKTENNCAAQDLFWKDMNTCVQDSSCSCLSHNSKIVTVSQTFQ